MRIFLSTLLLLCICLTSQGQVKPARIFGDHMVLQRNQPVPVWGTARKGENVTVSFNNQKVSAQADAKGNWKVVLQPMKEGGPYVMEISTKNDVIHYGDVMIGEVWLCSGQSNMEFVMQNALGFNAEQKVARQQNIRQFLVSHKMSLTPDKDFSDGQWVKADTNTIAYFTAVGYFFAKKVSQQLHVTVGLIHSSWGGTQAECWISREAMLADPNLQPVVKRMPSTWDGVKVQVDSIIRAYAFHNTPPATFTASQLAAEPPSYFDKWQKGGAGAWEWQGRWASYRGAGFMQRTIKLDSNRAQKASVLRLGLTDVLMRGAGFQARVAGWNFRTGIRDAHTGFEFAWLEKRPGRDLV